MDQKERKLIVFLAGELRNQENIKKLISKDPFDFYAADAGYRLAEKMNLPLHRVFGDFDSSDVPDLPNLTVYPCEKDQTDSELALDLAIQDGYRSIWMIAPFGGRLDHTLANVALLEKADKNQVDLKLYDGENLAFLLNKGKHIIDSKYRYISFFPIEQQATISLNGFKYSLDHRTVYRAIPMCISNEPTDGLPTIEIHDGKILCICIEQEAI